MTVVDAHHHVWDLSVRDQDWIAPDSPLRRNFTIEDLAPEARAAGVERTVLVQTITVPEETPEFLALAAAHDVIAGVVGWTDLTRPDVADELARLRELPGGTFLKGIRHQVQGEPDPEWLLRPDVRRGLTAVAAAGLVYDLVVLPHQLAACAKAAESLPQLTFVLDHLGKPSIVSGALEPWAADVRALAALPNTVCKLSGMITEADLDSWTIDDLRPYADTVLDAFGPDRLMFGSDWPVCTLGATYGEALDTARRLTPVSAHHQIFGATATRVYGLGDPG
ncbi:amidohydrolase [Streptomyces canus]|uniref:Amidohydrolase n=1 Tax=Streptomyces canus TaxID=58343 RepID=A0A117QX92_9ACTN|nr:MULTISPECIES: amidohydrolase family protein [Streptomyces]KUN58979.1 amidohydrolase [Streptomyces canus]MDI5904551.1 amidohydrolase family protein [Streptomyces sp. 12257]